ncbi:MAG: HAD-IA family hydrolase [Bacteroidota bacterium]
MHPIRFIYFDLDDTLLDHRHAEKLALGDLHSTFADAFNGHSLANVQATYHHHNVGLWHDYADGVITKDELKVARFTRLLTALNATGLTAEEANVYYMQQYGAHWHMSDEAHAAFRAVADAFPVGVITNGFRETQHAKLDRFPDVRDRLQALVISDEVGVMKPHPKLFAHAASLVEAEASSILYIGDSLRSDVQGATRAGWQVAWFTQDTETPPQGEHLRFHEWPALLAWLGVGRNTDI